MTHRNVLIAGAGIAGAGIAGAGIAGAGIAGAGIAGAGIAGPTLAYWLHRHGYLDRVSQVRMPRWPHGRVTVLGDAGYCPSPLSGMDTSLALTGAYILAGELAHHAHHAHHEQVFTRYEELLRPYAERAQDLPPGVPRVAAPRTRAGIRALHLVLRAAARPRVAEVLNRFLVPPADTFALPSYSL
ncbi:hypothetical protein ACFVXC_01175 [Streptomyces sp. NPDC058257]|uniref:hypothetical protein n=1 Tax=Streptomyces sp. NPDC058257 TaxID=3346409 RepID=UPI0036EB4F9B